MWSCKSCAFPLPNCSHSPSTHCTTPHSKWRWKKKIFSPYNSNFAILLLRSNDCMQWRHAWGWFRYINFGHLKLQHPNTSSETFTVRISSIKIAAKCLRTLNVLWTNFDIHLSTLLMSWLCTIVILSKISLCDIASNPSFCTFTCYEALYTVVQTRSLGCRPCGNVLWCYATMFSLSVYW